MTTRKNISISFTSSRTPKHNNVEVLFNFTNERNENEIELKLNLIDGKIIKSDLTSNNANIRLLNICSEFIYRKFN